MTQRKRLAYFCAHLQCNHKAYTDSNIKIFGLHELFTPIADNHSPQCRRKYLTLDCVRQTQLQFAKKTALYQKTFEPHPRPGAERTCHGAYLLLKRLLSYG